MSYIEAKLLDIIIPVYNKQEFLSDLINSLAILCKKSVNIIFVDDGSTDQSHAILKSNLLDNFFIYHKQNGGVSSARNFGLIQSKSKYIWFFDPDDQIGTDTIDIIEQLGNQREDVLIFNYCKKKIENNNIQSFKFDDYGVFDTCFFAEKYNYFSEKNNMSFIWNKFYKSEFIKNIFFDENVNLSEDRRFNLEVFKRAGSVCVVNKSLYTYYIYDSGTLSTIKTMVKIEDVYSTNIINISSLDFKREYIKKHIIEQVLSRAILQKNGLYEFYKKEHDNFEVKIFPFFSFKDFAIYVLLYLGCINIFIKLYNFLKSIKS